MISVPLTFWLSEHRKLGAVCASAVPTAVLGLSINLLSAPWHAKLLPLLAAWLGASFVGMTSMERLAGRHWMLPMLGLICGLMMVGAGPRLHGFGGLLGTNALVSVLAGFLNHPLDGPHRCSHHETIAPARSRGSSGRPITRPPSS